MSEHAPTAKHSTLPPRFGGWLAIFAITTILTTAGFVSGTITAIGNGTPSVLALLPLTACLLNLGGLVAIAAKRRWARPYWLALLPVYAVLMFWAWLGTDQQSLFNGAILQVAWWLYWLRSRRVAQQFLGSTK